MKKFMALFEMMPLHIGGSDMVSPIVAENRRSPTRPRSDTFTGDFHSTGLSGAIALDIATPGHKQRYEYKQWSRQGSITRPKVSLNHRLHA